MITIDRDYFSKIHDVVNSKTYNNEKTNYNVDIAPHLEDASMRPAIVHDLQVNGFAIATVGNNNNIEPNKIGHMLEDIFGEPPLDKNPGKKFYAKVQLEENAKHYINSCMAQPIHTDEGYTSEYPRYAALYCAKPSISGGISIIVPFKPLYSRLEQQFGDILKTGFIRDTLIVESFIGTVEKPLLINLESGNAGISYSPVLQKLRCSEDAFKLFDFVTTYVHDLNNQIRFTLQAGEVLLIDNCLALHGRTAFSKNNDRLLYRYWFGNRTL